LIMTGATFLSDAIPTAFSYAPAMVIEVERKAALNN